MKRHVKQALACSALGLVVSIALLFAFLGPPASGGGASEAIGRLFAMTAIAGIICGWMAGRSPQAWEWPKFAGVYVLVCVGLLVVSTFGRAHAAEHSAAPVRSASFAACTTHAVIPDAA